MKGSTIACLIVAIATWPTGSAQAQDDGKRLFASRCAACHLAPDHRPGPPRMGPDMANVVGRKAGTLPGFTRYSEAMKRYEGIWSEQVLDAYLANPRKAVPGTTMVFAGMKSPNERAAIIAYLKATSAAK